uniref:thromboxane-A synthase isoform X2 n=1 Tax=Myxine glutinosa TaxID=7769 RepID=UPI00358E5293
MMDITALIEVASNWINLSVALFTLSLILLSMYSISAFSQLKKIGIKHPTPLPFIGNMFWFKQGFFAAHQELARNYGNVCGFYFGRQPHIIVGDPEMLKQIMVKDFPNFMNRQDFPFVTKPLSDSVLLLKDHDWKRVRTILSPTFTGAKLKEMVPLITQVGDVLLQNLKKHAITGESVDVLRTFGNLTMDVIASVVFGIQLDSQNQTNHPFVHHAKLFFRVTIFRPIFFLSLAFPVFNPLWKKVLPEKHRKEVDIFFTHAIKQLVKQRKSQPPNERRRDFLQLILDAGESTEEATSELPQSKDETNENSVPLETRPQTKKTLSDDEIVGQALFFLVAGYETTSGALGFIAYLLATHPECQERLLREIDKFFQNNESPDYNNVQKLEYMEMVISEALRLYPPAVRFGRQAKHDCVVEGQFIPANMCIEVPVAVLHYDPRFWHDPMKYDPERFTTEAKAARHPFAYLPFGGGPRICIGMRLAFLEIKITLAKILQKFSFETCAETQIPLKTKSVSTLTAPDGVILKIVSRKES